MTVDVVARPGAVRRPVGLPPPTCEAARGTHMGAVEGTAELGVAVAAGRAAMAAWIAAPADCGIGGRRLQEELHPARRQPRAAQRRPHEKTATTTTPVEGPTDPGAHGHPRPAAATPGKAEGT